MIDIEVEALQHSWNFKTINLIDRERIFVFSINVIDESSRLFSRIM